MRILTALIIFAVLIYLYLTYSHFYNFLGEKKLNNPNIIKSYTLDNPSQKGELNYIALGDSLTAGVGTKNPGEGYVYKHASFLSFEYKKVNVLNLGIPGATTQQLIDYELQTTLLENPNQITILIGINDIHDKVSTTQFKKNYEQILDSLTQKTKAKITLINIPYLASSNILYFPWDKILDFKTREFNDIIASLSLKYNLKMIDLYGNSYQLFKQRPDFYSEDLFHPSAKGYQFWGEIINAN